ncbi:heme-binding protein [Reichenbachiella agarivorans]|uniref:Heme-binding protein n=1 Tax=Reichenbachiella agarivorans TaxID=2979464 RepID=A0ABY6CLV6_9BACT|nr:heme-binding protein [Reichenbachiella agarivorans]UXP31491.1 heme-binding protein [Reichenbachiella agarivorans]
MDLKKGIQALNTVIHECIREKKEAVVAVVDQNGDLVSFARTDHAPLSSIPVAINKAYTAARMRQDTESFGRNMHDQDLENLSYYSDSKLTPWAGGIPIFDLDGQLLGAIGVSGMSHTADAALALKAVEAIKPVPPKTEDKFKLYS